MFAPAPPPFAAGQPSQPSICQKAELPRPFPSEHPQRAADLKTIPRGPPRPLPRVQACLGTSPPGWRPL